MRVPSWSRRLSAHIGAAERPPFYARSFDVDPLGTAKTLLQWRDALVEAGWNGQAIAVGGERLATMGALEAIAEPLPVGHADRLGALERELRAYPQIVVYEGLSLVEPRALWSSRWQSIFALLEQRGAEVGPLTIAGTEAPPQSDLGVLQCLLRGEVIAKPSVRGDGSLLVLRGDTSSDLAELTAAFLGMHRDGAVVVRCTDEGPLESALAKHGIPEQGHATTSAWRPAMQILPLALELAFDPRDPYRVLELLTLPVGPFQGRFGAFLARAVSKQPGIGGTEWKRQKQKAFEWLKGKKEGDLILDGLEPATAALEAEAHATIRMLRLAEWLEATGALASGASRTALLAVAQSRSGSRARGALRDCLRLRVRRWVHLPVGRGWCRQVAILPTATQVLESPSWGQ